MTSIDEASIVRTVARIEDMHLGFEDHGILTGVLQVNYGGAAQGVGGYSIEDVAGAYIGQTLAACGVRSWEELKGRTIYVLHEGTERGRIVGIEPLPTEPGRRFLFADIFGEPS